MKIPAGGKARFSEALASISEDERFTIDRYIVKKGETFNVIAKKTGIPVPVILSLNAMEKIMPLKPGSVVYLPPKDLYSLDRGDNSLIKKSAYRKVNRNKSLGKKASYHKTAHKNKAVKVSDGKTAHKKKAVKVSAKKRLRTKSRKV